MLVSLGPVILGYLWDRSVSHVSGRIEGTWSNSKHTRAQRPTILVPLGTLIEALLPRFAQSPIWETRASQNWRPPGISFPFPGDTLQHSNVFAALFFAAVFAFLF